MISTILIVNYWKELSFRSSLHQHPQVLARILLTLLDIVPILDLGEVRPLTVVAAHIRPETIGIRL